MKLKINCPHCKLLLEVDGNWAGQRMACSSCGGQFVIPGVPGAKAPAPPAATVVRSAALRAATGGGRRRARNDDGIHFQEGGHRERHSHKTSPIVPVLLTVGALSVIGFIAYKFSSSKSIFETVAEDAKPRTYTLAELEHYVSSDKEGQKRFRTYVRNIANADLQDVVGRKFEKENRDKKEKMIEYLYNNILLHCPGADVGMARQAVSNVTTGWESDEEAKLAAEKAAAPAEGAKPAEGAASAPPPKPLSAEEAEKQREKKIEADAREEIHTFVAATTVPEGYAERGQWLAGELVMLRKEITGNGFGYEKLIYRVTRCDELFKSFEAWAKPEERSKASFEWARDRVKSLQSLKKQWKREGIKDEVLEQTLADIAKQLEDAENAFAEPAK